MAEALRVPSDFDEAPEARERYPLVAFNDVALDTRRRHLIKELIPREGLTVVWGPPKCGKSFWLSDALLHVALGREYRGRRVRQGAVVYCAFEGAYGFAARLEAFRIRHLAEQIDPVPFFLCAASLDLVKDHGALIESIRRQLPPGVDPVAVALDTLNRSLVGSESSDEDMGDYVKASDAIREAFRCAVVVVHHCGHEGSRPRGHSSLMGACDAQIAVTRNGADNVVAVVDLMKDGEAGAQVVSALDVVRVGLDEDGDPITSCVVVAVEGEATDFQGAKKAPQADIALRLLRKAIDEAGEPSPGGHHLPTGQRVISLSGFRTYFDAGTVAKTDKPDSRRRAFVRAVEKLQDTGKIGVWSDYLWLIEPRRTSRT